MTRQSLEFETPIYDLERKIIELQEISDREGLDFTNDLRNLNKKVKRMQREILGKLNCWQRTQLARHPDRPYTKDYIEWMASDFIELHGDRKFSEGNSIVGGFATLDGIKVMIVGHQKGRNTKENILRNFGMPNPEGYRKAMRLFDLAEKFNLPIITLLDTPGAYPGMGAEERGQAEAIATIIQRMFELSVPIICTVIGEGGSGGALGIGVGNHVLMLENAVYSVISPEGCAAILWNDADKIKEASESLCLTAKNLLEFGVIDEIVKEPIGGAHRSPKRVASSLRRVLRRVMKELLEKSPQQIKEERYKKFRDIGEFITL